MNGISDRPAKLDVSNPAPEPLAALSVVPGFSVIEISYLRPDDLDFAGVDIWVSQTQGFDPDSTEPTATVSDNSYIVSSLTQGETYYVRLRPFDLFGKTGTNTSAEFAVTTKTGVDITGLSGWAYEIAPVDRTFIQNNVEGGAIDLSDTVIGGLLSGSKLADLAVTAGKLAGSSVTETKIANLAVGTAAIQNAAIVNAKIGNLAVTDAKIQSLTAAKLTTGTLNATETITSEGVIRAVDDINNPQIQAGIGPIGLTRDGVPYAALMWAFDTQGVTFSIDELGNAYFQGDLEASTFTNDELTIDELGNLNSTGTFRFGGAADNFIDFNGTQLVIDTDNFSVDGAGNATFSGALSAATGTFSGDLNAAGGTFSGDLSAVGGTFSGTLDASSISTGTLDVARLANIGSAQIADGAIINAKIGNAQITTAKIDDAQVDTLQIKGEAVTIAQGGRRSSDLSIGSSWKNVVSFTYNHGEDEAIGGIIGGYLNAKSTTQSTNAVVELRVVYSGTPIESAVISAGESFSQNAAVITYTSLFTGTRAVTLQARTIYTDTTANVNGALTINGAKR
jgi:hypothetical protein